MAKKSIRIFSAAIFLTLVSITTTAFINKGKALTNGGGIAGGHLFNFSAEEYKSGISGHFSWDGIEYKIVCVNRKSNTALIYLSSNKAVRISDGKNGDEISAPFDATLNCSITVVVKENLLAVDGGNLTVYD